MNTLHPDTLKNLSTVGTVIVWEITPACAILIVQESPAVMAVWAESMDNHNLIKWLEYKFTLHGEAGYTPTPKEDILIAKGILKQHVRSVTLDDEDDV